MKKFKQFLTEETFTRPMNKKFNKMFKVVKDLQSLRVKSGADIEKILAEVRREFGPMKEETGRVSDPVINFFESMNYKKDKSLGTYFFTVEPNMRTGIPTGKIGAINNDIWEIVKNHLKDKKLIR